jgi:hypothetical protein
LNSVFDFDYAAIEAADKSKAQDLVYLVYLNAMTIPGELADGDFLKEGMEKFLNS